MSVEQEDEFEALEKPGDGRVQPNTRKNASAVRIPDDRDQ